jgi:hypothetical protein
MLLNDSLQSECLSLVASLYSTIASSSGFIGRRAECEAWLLRQVSAETPAAAFLRLQIARASEARSLATRMASEAPWACAVLTIDDRGRVIAAGAEAWHLLRAGSPHEDPLRLPSALRAFAVDASLSPSMPKALRVPLDDKSAELAGIVLGVDHVRHAVGAMRVITLLLCDVGGTVQASPVPAASHGRGELRAFRPVARGRQSSAMKVTLAIDRPA